MAKNKFNLMTGKQLVINRNITDPLSAGIIYDKQNQDKISKNNIFELHREPSMPFVLDLISQLGEKNGIILKARGKSIVNAVNVAKIITNNHLEERSIVHQETVDCHPIHEMSGLESTIEVIIKITNPKNS